MANPVVKSGLLKKGLPLISGALTGYSRFAAHSFKLGSGSGHDLDQLRENVVGSLVYTGDSRLIQARFLEEASVRYTMTVPEGVGPFSFGNIILYAVDFEGQQLPLLEIVLPFAVTKEVANPDLSSSSPFPQPGSRLVITAVIKHSIATNSAELISVQVITPSFSNMPFFQDDATLPPPTSQPWSQFVIMHHNVAKRPVLGTKNSDGTYWGSPFMQNLNHPDFGDADGGVQGDGYAVDPYSWAYGREYSTPSGDFRGILGGFSYTEFNSEGLAGNGDAYLGYTND